MKIEINLYATLSRYVDEHVKDAGGVVEAADGATVEDVLRQLEIPVDQVKLIFVDGVRADLGSILKDGSRLGAFPPVGGG